GASYNVAGLSAADHDMIFVNPARVINTSIPNGEALWTASEVNGIEASGGGKLLIGYLNVAKINDYVGYWNASWTSNGLAGGTLTGSAPAFLGAFDTANTRLVNFWEPAWKTLLLARIDAMVAQGFSGIFLDDLLQYFTQRGGTLAQIAQAAREMRDLVTDLAEHAKAVAPAGFAVIVNGAPFLINDTIADGSTLDLAAQTDFYAPLDGILVENYFSRGLGNFIAHTIAQYGARDIALLSVDTGQTTSQQQEEIEEAAFTAGFLPETTVGTVYSENTARVVPGVAAAPGNDLLEGGAGNDQLSGGGGVNTLRGGTGDDTYFIANASDTINEFANEGSDVLAVGFSYTLAAGVSIELITTGWIGGTAAINLTGNELANQIWGNDGINTLTGGDGDDALLGYGANDVLNGGLGADLLVGGLGADQLSGGSGDDTYILEDASDTITEAAGQGNDVIGVGLSYTLAAGISIELITTGFIGGTASVNLTGNELANQIWGNNGSNILNGGAGNDVLIGFGGADAFLFTTALGTGNIDTLADFDASQDVVRLDDAIFTGLALGELSSAAFVIGTGAADASDRIIYNSTTGALLFDADGTGPTAAVQFAALAAGLSLDFGDFLVV
ncbi:MAG TPA: endo alpha-1,4 polygalactosaminidase, partial [Allosphingosinicella sp.]|nr:endo alpha-1,4 polygalactosaminidase [Allosphingosinicella sp.]